MLDEPVIDLRRLRVLREVDRRGTISAAADALHLTPSAVSQQLSGLARDLDVPLLEKQGRGVRLTGQARLLIAHAEIVADQLDRARADLANWSAGTVGTVRVGSLATGVAALVGPAIARLSQERPNLEVTVSELEPPAVFEALDDGTVDVVVAVDYRDAPARSDARYLRRDLLSDRLDVVLPAGHRLATETSARRGIKLEQLADEIWVSSPPTDSCAMITTAVCAGAGFSPDVRHHCQEWDSAAALVAAGAGVALIPELAQPLRQNADLFRCKVDGPPAARLLFELARASAESAPPVMAVLDAIAAVAAERPDAL
ncbi:MAG: LysR family transcriptional regulator [Solirubrobacteraceae bacterium]|nr:LysR family transcriptional regulator [Solirubrobacteraceae bacterium]